MDESTERRLLRIEAMLKDLLTVIYLAIVAGIGVFVYWQVESMLGALCGWLSAMTVTGCVGTLAQKQLDKHS